MWDVDGKEYIDYVLAYGPLILGHTPEPVIQAIQDQLPRGTMFGTGFEQEYLLSEELVRYVPCADLARFCNSRSEAPHFVLRLARAYTGPEKGGQVRRPLQEYFGVTPDLCVFGKATGAG